MVEDAHMPLTPIFKSAVEHKLKQIGRANAEAMAWGQPTGEKRILGDYLV